MLSIKIQTDNEWIIQFIKSWGKINLEQEYAADGLPLQIPTLVANVVNSMSDG